MGAWVDAIRIIMLRLVFADADSDELGDVPADRDAELDIVRE